jgi:hypothetical protein
MNASPASSKPDVSREEFRELLGEVRELQRRISALEQPTQKRAVVLSPAPAPQLLGFQISSDAVPAIGRALLAIAGAYLLRALTELSLLPPKLGVAAGIVYAGFWLWRATQAPGKVAATVNVLSSIIIFGPLIWEATARLQAISPWTAAAAIAAYSLAAIWEPRIAVWSCSAGAAIAVVLLIGTHALLPFTIAILVIAACAEFATISNRWIVALSADAAILILIMMAAREGGLPEGYARVWLPAAVATLVGFLLVFIGSAVVQSLIRGRSFSPYEIGQTGCAFALATGGVLYLTKTATPVGMMAALAGAACYAIALHTRVSTRNIQTYAAFGALLAISGAFLLFSGSALIAVWSALAIGLSGTAFGSVHVPAFLWLAIAISGVAASSATQLFAREPGSFPIPAAIIILIAAAVSYFRLLRSGGRLPALLIAAAFVCAASGLAASLGAGAVVLMFAAIALAWSGDRWHRPELVWLMYAVMALAGGKILVRDFSRENTMTLVVSLLFYGATLIWLPRILKKN